MPNAGLKKSTTRRVGLRVVAWSQLAGILLVDTLLAATLSAWGFDSRFGFQVSVDDPFFEKTACCRFPWAISVPRLSRLAVAGGLLSLPEHLRDFRLGELRLRPHAAGIFLSIVIVQAISYDR